MLGGEHVFRLIVQGNDSTTLQHKAVTDQLFVWLILKHMAEATSLISKPVCNFLLFMWGKATQCKEARLVQRKNCHHCCICHPVSATGCCPGDHDALSAGTGCCAACDGVQQKAHDPAGPPQAAMHWFWCNANRCQGAVIECAAMTVRQWVTGPEKVHTISMIEEHKTFLAFTDEVEGIRAPWSLYVVLKQYQFVAMQFREPMSDRFLLLTWHSACFCCFCCCIAYKPGPFSVCPEKHEGLTRLKSWEKEDWDLFRDSKGLENPARN
jgi:hypothetical protein